jgi:hypothetical protein
MIIYQDINEGDVKWFTDCLSLFFL